MLEFRILGPFEAVDEDRALALGGPRQRALLAILLLSRGEVVSTGRLIDQLWGERPPATAAKTLQGYVSHLRKALGSDVLLTRGGGYVLAAAPEQVDVERFEALVAEARPRLTDGDPSGARELLGAALELWRGEPLADLAYEEFAQGEIARLEDARLTALEDRLDADLALGRHRVVVGELQRLVRKHPNRERPLAQLMLALYRSGRQTDALDVYQTGRRTLEDEFGLEPSPAIRELERRILNHDPALDPPTVPDGAREPSSRPTRGHVLILAGGALLLVAAIAAAVTVLAGGGSEVKLTAPDSVGVIDPSSGRIHATIPLGASPGGVAAGRGAVWVAITDQGTVLRVDPRTDAVRQTIRVGAGPAAVAAGGGAAWAANGADGTVSRIDPATNQVVQRIRVGNGPTGAAYGDGAVWVANSVDGTVSRIDPASGRVTRTFPAIVGATGVAFGFGRLWVVSSSAGEVASLDPASGDVVDRIGVGVDPDAIAVGLRAVWVANRADDTVSRIDPSPPAHVASAVPVGRAPNSLAVAGGGVWVANGGDGTLMRIDAAKGRVVKTVHLGDRPQGLAASPAGLYAAVRSSGAEHRGGTLRVVQGAPDSVDPAVAYSAEAWAILMMTNDGLVGFRRVGGIEGVQVVPDLATALPMPTAGGRTYTFRLRPGVRYSTGRPVQPEDFRRAIERVFQIRPASQTPAPQYLGGIVGARSCHPASCDLSRGIVTDARTRTVTFHLTAPDAGFLAKLALPFAFVVPSTTPASEIQRRPLPATGPYRLVRYRKGTSATLVRNPRFREWSADAQPSGYPDVLDFTFTRFNPESAVRAVSGGSADVARGLFPLPRRALEALASRFPSRLHLSTVAGTAFFFLNTRAAPFDDVRVRRAVNYAFDQQALARRTGLGSAPTCQIVPPDFPAYKPICPYGSGGSAGAVRARQLAGSSAGKPVTVWVPPPRVTEGRYMVSVLDALGLRARLKTAGSIDAYFNTVNDPKSRVQVGWYPWVADYPSQIGFLASLFSCAEFVLPTRFCDPQVQRTLAQATGAEAQNPPAAPALWQKAERQILAQGPIVPIVNQQDANFVSKRVGDFQYHPQWGVLLDQLWVR